MTLWRDDPDRAADALILSSLDELGLPSGDATALVTVDAGPGLRRTLFDERGFKGTAIVRRADVENPIPRNNPTPGEIGTFTLAFLRVPKSKAELEFTAHRLMGWLAPDSRIYIYGGNDEGIRSVPKRLASLGVAIETVAVHSHGRVLTLTRPVDLTRVKIQDIDWRITKDVEFAGARHVWASYPGLFADGKVDQATALLLDHLPTLATQATVLDYGCGTGIITRAILDRDSTTKVTAIDVDTFALKATSENAPTAKTLLSHRLKGAGRHDLIVSNPPIHNGFREDFTALHQMIEDAPKHLLPKGRLLFVVQRRVPVEAQMKARFETVDIIADSGAFRIWSASQPTRHISHDAKASNQNMPRSEKYRPEKYGDIEISDEIGEW